MALFFQLADAATVYKVQGLTVQVPKKMVADIKSMSKPAEAYVTLSRVQRLSQLVILDKIDTKNIKAHQASILELRRMESVATNVHVESSILSCNIRSLKKNYENFLTSSVYPGSEVICFQETWLAPFEADTTKLDCNLTVHHNAVGLGRGVTTLFSDKFIWVADVKKGDYQITKISSDSADILNVYRSR